MFQYQDFLKLQSYALFVVVHVADVVAFDVAHDGIECLWKACPVLALVLEEKICKHTKKNSAYHIQIGREKTAKESTLCLQFDATILHGIAQCLAVLLKLHSSYLAAHSFQYPDIP